MFCLRTLGGGLHRLPPGRPCSEVPIKTLKIWVLILAVDTHFDAPEFNPFTGSKHCLQTVIRDLNFPGRQAVMVRFGQSRLAKPRAFIVSFTYHLSSLVSVTDYSLGLVLKDLVVAEASYWGWRFSLGWWHEDLGKRKLWDTTAWNSKVKGRRSDRHWSWFWGIRN